MTKIIVAFCNSANAPNEQLHNVALWSLWYVTSYRHNTESQRKYLSSHHSVILYSSKKLPQQRLYILLRSVTTRILE